MELDFVRAGLNPPQINKAHIKTLFLVQVKEGTEKRGAIAATVRLVRKTVGPTTSLPTAVRVQAAAAVVHRTSPSAPEENSHRYP
jgi:hypothetical protein